MEFTSDDVLLQIFSYLKPITKIKCERVSKKWRDLTNLSWSNQTSLIIDDLFAFSNFNYQNPVEKRNSLNSCLIPLLKRCGKYLKILKIFMLEIVINYEIFECVISLASDLEFLTLEFYNFHPDCLKLVKNLKSIKSFELNSQNLIDIENADLVLEELIICFGVWKNMISLNLPRMSLKATKFFDFLLSVPQSVLHFCLVISMYQGKKSLMIKYKEAMVQFLAVHSNLETFELYTAEICNKEIDFDEALAAQLGISCNQLRCVGFFDSTLSAVCKILDNFPKLNKVKIDFDNPPARCHDEIFEALIGHEIKSINVCGTVSQYLLSEQLKTSKLISVTELHISLDSSTGFLSKLINLMPNLQKIFVDKHLFNADFFGTVILNCLNLQIFNCDVPLKAKDAEGTLISMLKKKKKLDKMSVNDRDRDVCLEIELPMADECYFNVIQFLKKGFYSVKLVNLA